MSNDYRPTSRRQRLLIIAATAAMVVTVWVLLVHDSGAERRKLPAPPPPPCAPGQTTGCVGGKADVMLIAPAAPASGVSAPAR